MTGGPGSLTSPCMSFCASQKWSYQSHSSPLHHGKVSCKILFKCASQAIIQTLNPPLQIHLSSRWHRRLAISRAVGYSVSCPPRHRSRGVVRCSSENGSSNLQDSAKAGLSELDQQLQMLAEQNGSVRRPASREEQREQAGQQEVARTKTEEFPEFDDGFLLYAGGGLLLLTIVTNILYQTVNAILEAPSEKPLMDTLQNAQPVILSNRSDPLFESQTAPPLGPQ